MWPRICEAILALWLLFSPAVLIDEPSVTRVARGAAVLMLAFSSLSFLTASAARTSAPSPSRWPPPAIRFCTRRHPPR